MKVFQLKLVQNCSFKAVMRFKLSTFSSFVTSLSSLLAKIHESSVCSCLLKTVFQHSDTKINVTTVTSVFLTPFELKLLETNGQKLPVCERRQNSELHVSIAAGWSWRWWRQWRLQLFDLRMMVEPIVTEMFVCVSVQYKQGFSGCLTSDCQKQNRKWSNGLHGH